MSENEKRLFFFLNEINLHLFQQAICCTKRKGKKRGLRKKKKKGKKMKEGKKFKRSVHNER